MLPIAAEDYTIVLKYRDTSDLKAIFKKGLLSKVLPPAAAGRASWEPWLENQRSAPNTSGVMPERHQPGAIYQALKKPCYRGEQSASTISAQDINFTAHVIQNT
ncbi:hypothetical protein MRX96_050573 [Rhipicephalus microplus]